MTDREASGAYVVLLVEDNPGDVRLIEEAFEASSVEVDLSVVTDGGAALDFLFRRGDYRDAPCPHIVLLDLNLPKRDGQEVLREVKEDPELKRIPVIVLTSSEAPRDVAQSYDLRASAYVTKPVGAAEFMELIDTIATFWLSTVRLPPRPARA